MLSSAQVIDIAKEVRGADCLWIEMLLKHNATNDRMELVKRACIEDIIKPIPREAWDIVDSKLVKTKDLSIYEKHEVICLILASMIIGD